MNNLTIENQKPVKPSNEGSGSGGGGSGSVEGGVGGGSGIAKVIEESDIVKGEQPKKAHYFSFYWNHGHFLIQSECLTTKML